jgi:hypothetical protein
LSSLQQDQRVWDGVIVGGNDRWRKDLLLLDEFDERHNTSVVPEIEILAADVARENIGLN